MAESYVSSTSGGDQPVLSTFSNGLRVIEELSGQRRGVRELAGAVGLNRQTTYRLLRTLVEAGWAERDPTTDTYALTSRLWALAAQSFEITDLRDMLSPAVNKLAETYGETVHLTIYEAGSVVYIDKADGSEPIRAYTVLGGRAPAYCVATGKVLLAYQPEAERERVLETPIAAFSPNTITDPGKLRAELDDIRERGYAVNRGEWRAQVGGIAIPVCSPLQDVVAALGFSGPVQRIMDNFDKLLGALRNELAERDLPRIS
ncbi:IclR family transcriptional regulator [Tamaricihabitans halophyticus]|uniref:IclR family transcriptional regulator n=1 Tax=Tamaricihabitans halophyticus TaxID=1262583 RepID=A0A4V2SSR7_9PSEU|nr:IclR family transcriptional regulator [Tamaricihabitans halophyticus]TCP47836.1 IclR family transcriptional regulator [Tamaricihabitans halophyticus]